MHTFIAILLSAVGCSGSLEPWRAEPNAKSWIWGEGVPHEPDDYDVPVQDWYPGYGIIKLKFTPPGAIEIEHVQKIPWMAGSFCKMALPAAFYAFTLHPNPFDISAVKSVTVTIDAHPYIAACKCYVRTFIAMGFTRLASRTKYGNSPVEDVTEEDKVDTYCSTHRTWIGASVPELEVAHLPPLAPGAMALLLSANTTLPETPKDVDEFLQAIASASPDIS